MEFKGIDFLSIENIKDAIAVFKDVVTEDIRIDVKAINSTTYEPELYCHIKNKPYHIPVKFIVDAGKMTLILGISHVGC